MKIGGIDPSTLSSEEILVIPRGQQEIVFRARGILDYDEFNKLSPPVSGRSKAARGAK